MGKEQNKARIWELDFLRGIALLCMIYFHVVFDMREFFGYPVIYSSGINYFIGKTSGILFMFVSGASCSLSKSNVKRGLRILGIALAITVATHVYNPGYGIKFGILHFLGVSILLYPLLAKVNKYLLLVLGTATILLGRIITKVSVDFDYLFPLGIISDSFISSDYYPLIPWFGVFIYGIALGKFFYTDKRSLFKFSLENTIISKIGKKTLLVYLIHQPLIFLALTLLRPLLLKP